MKVYLCRHGDAVQPVLDPECPLSESGRCQIREVAGNLKASNVKAARVEHSPKARARETAEILAAAVAPGVRLEERGDLNPDDLVEDWVIELGHREEDSVLVGHLPFMGDLARSLLGPGCKDLERFTTGSVLCLERVGESVWKKVWMRVPGA